MKFLLPILSLMLVTPVMLPPKWGMSLEAKSHHHKKPPYLSWSEDEYRKEMMVFCAYLMNEIENLHDEVDRLRDAILELDEK